MKILIIGLGYAGGRFLNAAKELEAKNNDLPPITLAYADPSDKRLAIPHYRSLETALKDYDPDIVINSSNDVYHLDVIKYLHDFKGFLLNEKPLITPFQDIQKVTSSLSGITGFAMDMIERYSETTSALKKYVSENNLTPVRISFIWGKNRLEDHRPTCGVGSEVIHALDLIEYILPAKNGLLVNDAVGVASDFSISGLNVLDTVHLTATYDGAVVDGYASFVNIDRQRNIDFTFRAPNNELVYARLVYDTPNWDMDSLHVWKRNSNGQAEPVLELKLEDNPNIRNARGLYKIKAIVEASIDFCAGRAISKVDFCDLKQSTKLYNLINEIYELASNAPTTVYHPISRRIVTNGAHSETLG